MKFKETLLDCGEIRPRKRNLFACLQRETNLKCLILTLLLSGCLVTTVVWCSRRTFVTTVDFDAFPIATTRQVSPCDEGFAYIPAAFIITLYFVYLVECYHSKAHEMLSLPKIDVNTVYRKVHQMRRAKPLVWWKAICYHYVDVRRSQFTRYRNGDPGDAFTTSKMCYERVNSHAATSFFSFFMCGMKDVSRDLVDLEKHAVTKVRFKKGFIFSNTETTTEFQDQRAIFFQEQEQWDDYMEMKEGLDLANVSFAEQVTSWANADDLPWFGRTRVFWLCSFFLLSWPLRIILELNTAHVHYQVTKLFGTNYLSHDDYTMRNLGDGANTHPPSSSDFGGRFTASVANDIQPHQWWRRAIWLSHLVHPFKHHQRRGGRELLLDQQQQQQTLDTLDSSASSTIEDHPDENVRQQRRDSDSIDSSLLNMEEAHLDLPLLPNRRKKFNGIWTQHHLHHIGRDTINEEEDFDTPLTGHQGKFFGSNNNWAMWQHDGGGGRTNFPRSVTLLLTEPRGFLDSSDEQLEESCDGDPRRHSDSFPGQHEQGQFGSGESPTSCNLVPTYSQALLLMSGSSGQRSTVRDLNEGRRERRQTRRESTLNYDNSDNYGLTNSSTLLTESEVTADIIPPSSFHHSSPPPQFPRNHHNVENGILSSSSSSPPPLLSSQDDDEPFLQVERLGPQPTTNTCNEPRERPCRLVRGRRVAPSLPTSNSLSTFSHSPHTSSSPPPPSNVLLRSFTVSNFQSIPSTAAAAAVTAPTPSRSDSFRALCAVMPRSATGVEIDLTHPVSASVPLDPLTTSNSAQHILRITRPSASSLRRAGQTNLVNHHQQQQQQQNTSTTDVESPPNYIEALRTSRPVFLPPWTRLRRCFTEKNLNSPSSSTTSSAATQHYKCRRPVWLQDVRPTFLLSNSSGSGGNRHNPCKSSSTFPVPL